MANGWLRIIFKKNDSKTLTRTQNVLFQCAHEFVEAAIVLLWIGQKLTQALHGERCCLEIVETFEQQCLHGFVIELINIRTLR